MYVCVYVCIFVCMCLYMLPFIVVCMYVCMYAFMNVCIFVCMHVFTGFGISVFFVVIDITTTSQTTRKFAAASEGYKGWSLRWLLLVRVRFPFDPRSLRCVARGLRGVPDRSRTLRGCCRVQFADMEQ